MEILKVLTATLLLSLLIGPAVLCGAEPSTSPDRSFDSYGAVRWEDEKARLDNFAISLQNDESILGYILVYDQTGGCPGEATARALRARRYLTEYRGIPWNRVIWRRDGYASEISTTLLLAPKSMILPNPFGHALGLAVDGPSTRACRARLSRIRRDR